MRQKGFIPILIVIIIALAAIAGAYYFGTKKGNIIPTPTEAPSLVATNLPTQTTPTVKPTIDPTANWKTFTSKYGYSVKYPQNYSVKTGDWTEFGQSFGIQKNDEIVIRSIEQTKPKMAGPYGDLISLKLPEANPQHLSSEQWANEKLQSTDYPAKIVTHEVVVNKIKSIQAYRADFPGILYVFVPQNEKIYTLVHAPSGIESEKADYKQTFNQILSTFKFTQ